MRLCVLLSAVAAWLAACGGSDPPPFANIAPDAAQEALVTQADLPPGWRVETGSALDRVELSEQCDILTPGGAFPDAGATASSPSFATVDRRSAQSFSAVFESDGRANAAITSLDATVDRCRDEFMDAVRDAAEAELDSQGLALGPFADIDVAIDHSPLDGTGDQASVYQVRVSVSVFGAERAFNADIALVRRGRVIGVLLHAAYGDIAPAEEEAFLDLLTQRLAKAEDMLP